MEALEVIGGRTGRVAVQGRELILVQAWDMNGNAIQLLTSPELALKLAESMTKNAKREGVTE